MEDGRREELERGAIQGAAVNEGGSSSADVTISLLPERIRAREAKRAEILVGFLKRCTRKRFAEVRQVLEMLPKDVLVEELRKVPAGRGH